MKKKIRKSIKLEKETIKTLTVRTELNAGSHVSACQDTCMTCYDMSCPWGPECG